MATRKRQAEAPLPAFYVAAADLFIGSADAGVMPVAAFRKGDQVPPGMVEPNGWQDQVTDPGQPDDDVPAAQPEDEPLPVQAPADMPVKAGKE